MDYKKKCKEFNRNVKAEMIRRGLLTKEVAHRMGIKSPTLSNSLRNSGNMTLITLLKLEEATGIKLLNPEYKTNVE